ncbi:MAG TPA: hypothetical protein VIV59_11565, partial [Anaeromyxobacteraceae bacterium]
AWCRSPVWPWEATGAAPSSSSAPRWQSSTARSSSGSSFAHPPEDDVMDALFLALISCFYAATWGLARLCARL